jgi:hypothetical protein
MTLAGLGTLWIGVFGLLVAWIPSDNSRGLVALGDARLGSIRGLDRSKYIIGSYSCEQASAADFNQAFPGFNTVGADSCPSQGGPICIACEPPGTNIEFIVVTSSTGQGSPSGLLVNASVSCGPKQTGRCAVANGENVCSEQVATSNRCTDITEYANQPHPVEDPPLNP